MGQHQHVIVAFISSQLPENLLPTDIQLIEGENSFRTSGLKRSSVIRLHKLLTVRTFDMKRRLGYLIPELHDEIVAKVHSLF
ncbi:type II toxin-antitoxin system PemK/MazF family toxin [Alicyclobacillus tolerans]|nr:type II toxin-antitoxin system PemK/MazF family toxin [Alicyclobacillus tolerans]